ncbi:FAD binding domain-containing protein [Zopfia rhizophila CBS 207.26]|uniref:FAD binding domain-containing protein n=1 Tax=Zopfia rhizophila CBS 207.26 TaxID=1314779 RepID=A0A6A6E3Z1_9PEZI|nr:FAD binding domain-containing protein [Zopfia rhizophila CBS 207.26]
MAPTCSFSLVTATLCVSIAHSQASASQPAIEPASTVVPFDSPAGAPLLEAETLQLTDAVVHRIANTKSTVEYVDLFAFDDGASANASHMRRNRVWDIFDYLLDGALIPTVPIGAPCYDSEWGAKNPKKCDAVIKGFNDPHFHEADPTSIMFPIFQGRTCMPGNSTTGECTLGGYPEYAVNVTNVAQIQLALNFARNANIRLVIKNTGHCYLGKSSGAGSLSIWTHNVKDIQYLPNYKGPGYSGKAIKVGAGATVREVYEVAEKHGVSALGGICESVGFAGGYIAGGGHTPLSGLYGMAADQVVALQVVTADGRFITVSEDSYPDLFWALRGGGGGTYGIVTSVIIRVHPKVPVVHSNFIFSMSPTVSKDTFWQGVRKYFELFIPFTDAGTYSFFFVFNTNGTLRLDMRSFFAPNHTIESFNKLTAPWFDYLKELNITFTTGPNTTYYESFYPAYMDAWGKRLFPVGSVKSLPGNRLLPRRNFEDPAKFNATFDVLRRHVEAGSHLGGYHQAPRNRANVDNAVSSAFRDLISFLITSSPQLPDNTTPEQMKIASDELTNNILKPWREVAPASEGGGSYLNEASVMEPDWQASFYGKQYPGLLKVKKKWDPRSVFYATTAVGSEEWEVQDGEQGVQTQNGRLCRV